MSTNRWTDRFVLGRGSHLAGLLTAREWRAVSQGEGKIHMKNMLERLREARAARQENRDAGFSLIELIVVIAIIGILIAIAIPVYGNIQKNAKDNQLKNAAATGASVAAAHIVEKSPASLAALNTELDKSEGDDYTLTAALSGTETVPSTSNFCITAAPVADKSLVGGTSATSGPGCP